MFRDENVNDAIFLYLVYNHGRFKFEFTKYIEKRNTLLANEDKSLHDEINNQFFAYIRSRLVDEITKSLGVSVEDAIIVVEALDVNRYIIEN